jgi:ABC-type polysaccharide/polyol phosphate export permease
MLILKEIASFYQAKSVIINMSINDFTYKFLGSYLGILWAILRPLIFISVIWLIFSIGFKRNILDNNTPFILYLLTGYIPWLLFTDALSSSMNSIVNNKFLLNNISFKIGVLPINKIICAFYIHIIFLSILIVVLLIHGYYPSIYWIQLPFYMIMLSILLSGLGWLTASLRVFSKDVEETVSIILQIGFWISPIFWSISAIPSKYHWVVDINPMSFIIQGYRNSFVNNIWFWETTGLLTYSILTSIIFVLGIIIFKKLRPHFYETL